MSQRTRVFFLLTAMVWQALLVITPYGLSQTSRQLAHAIEHMQAVEHHHHDDQTLHLEANSDESFHQHPGEGMQPTGLIPFVVAQLPGLPPSAPAAGDLTLPYRIFLEGPLRPPTFTA